MPDQAAKLQEAYRMLGTVGGAVLFVGIVALLIMLREDIAAGVASLFHRYVRVYENGQPVSPSVKHFDNIPIETRATKSDDDLLLRNILSSEKRECEGTNDAEKGTNGGNGVDSTLAYLQLNRTRDALIETMIRAGWNVEQMKGALKGKSVDTGNDIAAVKQRLAGGQAAPSVVVPVPPVEPPAPAKPETYTGIVRMWIDPEHPGRMRSIRRDEDGREFYVDEDTDQRVYIKEEMQPA